MTPFRLAWYGGSAERRFRTDRPLGEIAELDFATLDGDAYPRELVERARAAWTFGAFQEYATGAAFAAIQTALLEAGAPIDLVAMASAFVGDEMLHSELNARIAVALGGGVSPAVNLERLVPEIDAPPLERALRLVVRTCCVGEAFSTPVLAATMTASTHPVIKTVLRRIVRDEAPHSRLGWLVLDWAAEMIDGSMRQRLGAVARDALAPHVGRLSALPEDSTDEASVHALGWMQASAWAACAIRAGREKVIRPLAARGIDVGDVTSLAFGMMDEPRNSPRA